MSVRLALIAALDNNRAIGRDNAMPWHLPEDLKRFKRLTLGHSVLMGRRTAESIGRALPGRRNLVLTRSGSAPFAGQHPVASLDEALAATDSPILFVIGGAEVYALTLPQADTLHLTWVDTEVVDADTWFPDFDATQWQVVAEQSLPGDSRHAFACRFVDYRRRSENPTGPG